MNLTEFRKSSKSDRPHYVLLGHPVKHSWSPLMHNTALQHFGMDAEYFAINLNSNELSDLGPFLNRNTFLGANITIPYKQVVIDYLDEINRSAREIEAINTVVKQNYRLKGYNTDYDGFLSPLKEYESEIDSGSAIVFGTGGAARAVVLGLVNMGVETIYLVSRTPNRISSFENIDQVSIISYSHWTSFAAESSLIVNATPLGMYPNNEQSPVRDSESKYLANRYCYDLVYNPLRTKFLQQAEGVGAKTITGLEMLIHQGSKSFELWTGQPFPIEIIRNTLYEKFGN